MNRKAIHDHVWQALEGSTQKQKLAEQALGQALGGIDALAALGFRFQLAPDIGTGEEHQEYPKMLYHDHFPGGMAVTTGGEEQKMLKAGWRTHPNAELGKEQAKRDAEVSLQEAKRQHKEKEEAVKAAEDRLAKAQAESKDEAEVSGEAAVAPDGSAVSTDAAGEASGETAKTDLESGGSEAEREGEATSTQAFGSRRSRK